MNLKNIEHKVGQVNSYSNKYGEHLVVDAFSNTFPVGTELYKIKDEEINSSIAKKIKYFLSAWSQFIVLHEELHATRVCYDLVVKVDSIYLHAIER